jgi:sterol desaturase/sphingolipid hydroxylase (fatty acid hydroxylase superfamily)
VENVALAASLALLVALERVPALRLRELPLLRPFFATDAFYLGTGALGLGLALRAAAAPFAGVLDPGGLRALPAWAAVPIAVVLYDVAAFAAHVLMHRSERLWRVHQVHHSSLALDWLATFRAHAVEHALRHLASPVALLLLGLPAGAVAAASAFYAAWAAFNHANLRLPLRGLEAVLVTPRLHRLHHVPATSQRNFGTIFSLWDRLAGSLAADPGAADEPLGVPGARERYPQRWLPQLAKPFRSA